MHFNTVVSCYLLIPLRYSSVAYHSVTLFHLTAQVVMHVTRTEGYIGPVSVHILTTYHGSKATHRYQQSQHPVIQNFVYTYRKTRKLSYRIDDRAMRHMYGCRQKLLGVPQSQTTPTATFREIFNGLLFRSSLYNACKN